MKGWTMKWKCTFEHRECSVFFSSLTEFGVSPLSSKLNQGGSKVAVEPKPKQHPTQNSIFNEHFRTIFSEGKIFFHRTVVGGVTAQSLVCFYWEGYTSLTCYKFHFLKRAKERERDQMIRGLGRYPVITSSGWLGGCKLCYNAVSWRVKSAQGWDLKGFLALTYAGDGFTCSAY